MQLTDRIPLFQTRMYLTYQKYSIQFVSLFILDMMIINGVDLAWRTEKIMDSHYCVVHSQFSYPQSLFRKAIYAFLDCNNIYQ